MILLKALIVIALWIAVGVIAWYLITAVLRRSDDD